MKKKILVGIMLVFGLLSLVACGGEEDTTNSTEEVQDSMDEQVEVEEEAELEIYYDGNEAINLYLNNFNTINPDAKIEKGMFEVYHHHGKDHEEQIIMYRDGFEIVISDVVNLEVYADGEDVDTEAYKVIFKQFAKGYNTALTDDVLDGYWQQLLDDSINCVEFEEFECDITIYNDKIEYMKLSGKLE